MNYQANRKSLKEARAQKACALKAKNKETKDKIKALNAMPDAVDGRFTSAYFKQLFKARAEEEYPDDKQNRDRYYILKWRRYKFCANVEAKGDQVDVIYKYNSPGREGYEWILRFCPTLKDFCKAPIMDPSHYGITQYYNKSYAGKIVENATCFDKTGAYVSWLLKPLPYKEELNSNDSVSLYNYNNGASFNKKSAKPHSQYSLRRIPGIDAWYEDYKALLAKDKPRAKKLAVSAIGYMKRLGLLIPYYIWHMQGVEINDIKLFCQAAGNTVLKIHTDSITYLDNVSLDDDIIKYGYKCEFQKERIYIVNAGCYHVECKNEPYGYNSPYNDNCVHYENEIIPYNNFPCLRAGEAVYFKNGKDIMLKQLGEHNEL